MAEWPNVPDSKSGVAQVTVGSNPTLSANKILIKNGLMLEKAQAVCLVALAVPAATGDAFESCILVPT